jgi:hypothetical protein
MHYSDTCFVRGRKLIVTFLSVSVKMGVKTGQGPGTQNREMAMGLRATVVIGLLLFYSCVMGDQLNKEEKVKLTA